jgi:HK97 family phage major capsid protein
VLTKEIKQAERDIARLEGEVRDAASDLASTQKAFEGKNILDVADDSPELVALSEAGKKYDALKDNLLTAVGRVRQFDRGAEEVLQRDGLGEGKASEGHESKAVQAPDFGARLDDIVSGDGFKSAMVKYAQATAAAPVGRSDYGEFANVHEAKALVTRGQGGIDFLSPPGRRPLVDLSPYEELTILDLVTVGSTDDNTIEYPAFLGRSGAAAVIPDPTGTTPATATLKPDIGLAWDIRTGRARTIAAGIPVHRNILEDNPAYLRTVIREQLIAALRTELHAQILSGSGVGENFTGILNTSGTVPIAAQDATHTTETDVEAIHRAITALRLTGDNATAIVVHPVDFEAIRLDKDTTGNYYYGPPATVGPLTIWGKRVVDSVAIPQGTALLADWSAVQLLFRKGISLLSSDSHSDFFMRNLIQFLAELRAMLLVTRPGAIVEITGLND